MRETDYEILMNPELLLDMLDLLIQTWSNLLRQSTTTVWIPPREDGETLFNPTLLGTGRFIAKLPNGFYAGVFPTHAVYPLDTYTDPWDLQREESSAGDHAPTEEDEPTGSAASSSSMHQEGSQEGGGGERDVIKRFG